MTQSCRNWKRPHSRSKGHPVGSVVAIHRGRDAEAGELDPVEARPSEYRLAVRVEPGGIALEQRGDEPRGALDVIVAQIRADGADARRVGRVDISVSGERLQQFLRDGLRIEHTASLVPEAERLRVVVRDARTGAIGAIRAVGVSGQQLEAIVR